MNNNCLCNENYDCHACLTAGAINDMMMDHFDYEPSPYSGDYSEM